MPSIKNMAWTKQIFQMPIPLIFCPRYKINDLWFILKWCILVVENKVWTSLMTFFHIICYLTSCIDSCLTIFLKSVSIFCIRLTCVIWTCIIILLCTVREVFSIYNLCKTVSVPVQCAKSWWVIHLSSPLHRSYMLILPSPSL